jgi:hypothetical protein
MRLIPVIADFEEVAAFCISQRSHGPVIDDQNVDMRQLVEQFAV